jgi:hypothetical protein
MNFSVMQCIATNVRRFRVERQMTQGQLASQMTEMGVPWGRAAVTNLELNSDLSRATAAQTAPHRRQSLAVEELIAFSLIFRVPLLALLLPQDGEATIDLTPTAAATVADAGELLGGERGMTDSPAPSLADVERIAKRVARQAVEEALTQVTAEVGPPSRPE